MNGSEPAATISLCPDGPLLVRGDFELRDLATGEPVDRRRNVIALCRCGRSEIRPFCDGSHLPPRRPTAGANDLQPVTFESSQSQTAAPVRKKD